jgi:hypothetical protein
MWWRTRHGRGPPARHHLLEQLPGPAERPCRVPLAAALTPCTAPFPRSGLNTHERSGEEPFKRSSQAQNPRSHTAPASLQRSRTLMERVRLFWSDLIVPVRNCPATICGGGRGMAGVLQPATTCSNSSRDRPNAPAASRLLLRLPLAPLLSHVLVSTPTNVAGRSPSNDQVRHKTPGHTQRRPHSGGAAPLWNWPHWQQSRTRTVDAVRVGLSQVPSDLLHSSYRCRSFSLCLTFHAK